MTLITYGGVLLRRGGSLAASLACCCEPPDCCDLPNNVEVTLTLSDDFSYSCSQASEWSPDGGVTFFFDFESIISLAGVAGIYTATTTYADCVVGDFSIDIGPITFRIFAKQKIRQVSRITEWTSDQTWTGDLKLERVGGVTKFYLYNQVRTSATVLSVIAGEFHDDTLPPVSCLGANEFSDFFVAPPCDEPTDFSSFMYVFENMPSCETVLVDGEYVFIYTPGIGDAGFTLPDRVFGALGLTLGGGPGDTSDTHVPLYTQSPECLHPNSFSVFAAGAHIWTNALEYEIVEPA